MAVQIPPGFAQASIEHWLANYTRPAVTVWGLDVSAYPDDADDLAQTFHSQYVNYIGLRIDSNVTIRGAKVLIGQDGGDPVIGTSTDTDPGGRSSNSTSPALALMAHLNTGLGGRRNRGRKYFPWALGDDAVSEQGAVLAADITAWNTNLANFLEAMENNFAPVVLLHGPGVTSVPVPTPVTTMLANGVVRTQKQRQARF